MFLKYVQFFLVKIYTLSKFIFQTRILCKVHKNESKIRFHEGHHFIAFTGLCIRNNEN